MSPNSSQSLQRVPYQQVETQYQNQIGGQLNSTVMNVPVHSQSQSQYDLGINQASFGQHNEPLSPEFSRVEQSGQNSNTLGFGSTGVNPQVLAYNLGNAEMSSPVNQANLRS